MLRSTAGTNVFGGTVKITIDGRLNASGITLKGQGATSEQIKASMTGGAQVGGHVFVGGDKALTTIGSVAAGGGRRCNRQHAGQCAGRCRPAQHRQQPAHRSLGAAQSLRQPRQPDLGPYRHRGRRA
jgi:hypothetical protein